MAGEMGFAYLSSHARNKTRSNSSHRSFDEDGKEKNFWPFEAELDQMKVAFQKCTHAFEDVLASVMNDIICFQEDRERIKTRHVPNEKLAA
jgi:hypothetical protein